jgi:CsoR family transcriptional regulator, copper-sensing transcriptional repressor
MVNGSPGTMRGYSAEKDALLKRLARIEGQVRGVTRMVEEDRYCIEVLTQIAAMKSAVEQVALRLVDGHVRNCMAAAADERDEKTAELMSAVGRLLKV